MAELYRLLVDGTEVAHGDLGECWGQALLRNLIVGTTNALTLKPRAMIARIEESAPSRSEDGHRDA